MAHELQMPLSGLKLVEHNQKIQMEHSKLLYRHLGHDVDKLN